MSSREQNAHRETMALGSDTKPPVLYRGEFPQWKTRFEMWIDNHPNGEEMLRSLHKGDHEAWDEIPGQPDADPPLPPQRVRRVVLTDDDRLKLKADKQARVYLLQALPNDLFVAVDSFKTANEIYMEIERQMKGSVKGRELKTATVIHNYETFRARDNESLEEIYARLCSALNDLRKTDIQKSQFEVVIKFVGCLQPEWKKYTIPYKVNDLKDTDFHTLFENLLQYQDDVQSKIARRLRKDPYPSSDKLALISDRRSRLPKKPKTPSPVTTPSASDSESDEDVHDMNRMEKQLILLTKSFEKQFGKKIGSSNQLRYTSGSKKKDKPDYKNKGKDIIDDGYRKKKEHKRREDDKGEKLPTCYNCGKTGHYARECRLPKQRSAEYYRRKASTATEKMKLAKDRERGKALLIEEDHWLDASSSSDSDNDETIAFMAKVDSGEEDNASASDSSAKDDTDSESEVHHDPMLLKFHNQLTFLNKRITETKFKLKSEKDKNKELEARHHKNYKLLSDTLKENAALASHLEFTKKELENLLNEIRV